MFLTSLNQCPILLTLVVYDSRVGVVRLTATNYYNKALLLVNLQHPIIKSPDDTLAKNMINHIQVVGKLCLLGKIVMLARYSFACNN